MSTQFWVPGPVLVYPGTGASGAYDFLGWFTAGVRINVSAEFEDVLADFGGIKVPVDSTFQGEQGYVSGDLSKYSEAVYNKLAARTASAVSITAGAAAGTIPAASTGAGIGTLMVSEGAAVKLCLLAPNATAKTYFNGMNPCLVFSQTWLDGAIDQTWNSHVKNPRVTFRALPSWAGSGASAVLYTYTTPGSLPSPA